MQALLFSRLIATLRFLPKSFYFFFNRIARYAQSKESRNLSGKNSQSTCKAIFRNCHNRTLFTSMIKRNRQKVNLQRENAKRGECDWTIG